MKVIYLILGLIINFVNCDEDNAPLNCENFSSTLQKCILNIHAACDPEDLENSCPENAECQIVSWENGKYVKECRCKEDFSEAEDQQSCHSKSNYGETCNDDKSCKRGLKCNQSNGHNSRTCECRGNSIWYSEEKACYVPPGSLYYDHDTGTMLNCAPGSDQEKFFCQCIKSYKPDNAGLRCLGTIGAECDKNQNCFPSLSCNNGFCECSQFSLGVKVVGEGVACEFQFDGICNDKDSTVCPKNAFCNNGTCTCSPGFIKTSDKVCLKGVNEPCVKSDMECNHEHGLTCSAKGRCICADSINLNYVPGKGCSGGKNSLCGTVRPQINTIKSYYMVHCIEGLICKTGRGSDAGTCQEDQSPFSNFFATTNAHFPSDTSRLSLNA